MTVPDDTLVAERAGPADQTTGARPRRRGHPWLRALVLAASVVFVVVVAWRAWDELVAAGQVMRTLAPGVIAIAVLLQAVAIATLPCVYRASVRAVGSDLSYRQSLQLSMGAFALSRVVPGGGAAGGLWAARRLQHMRVPLAPAGTAVLLEGLLAMATLGVIVMAGTVAALIRGHVSGGTVAASVAVAALFLLAGWACVALLASRGVRSAVFSVLGRLRPSARDRLDAWWDSLEELRTSLPGVRQLLPVVAWSAVNWVAELAALWTIFAGLGIHMELGVMVVGFGVANLVTALPHTPGGLGLVEAGMAGTYVALGTDTAVALAGVLAYRLIAYWLPVLMGVPQYLRAPVTAGSDAS